MSKNPAKAPTAAPAPAAMPAAAPAPVAGPTSESAPTNKKARVLVFCALGQPNDVVELSDGDLVAYASQVDPNPDAVAYAESLK